MSLAGSGQVHDVETWLGTAAKIELNKRFNLEVGQQIRFNTFLTTFDQYLVNPELSFGKKGFSAALAYRFSIRNQGHAFISTQHRYQAGLGYRHRFGDFRLGTKVRYQQEFFPIRNAERIPYGEAGMTLRHKLDVKYEREKAFQPFIAFEYFLPLDNGELMIGRLRYRAGVSVDLPKKMDLSFYYTLEQQFDQEQPVFIHTLGIFHSFAPKMKRNKKKD